MKTGFVEAGGGECFEGPVEDAFAADADVAFWLVVGHGLEGVRRGPAPMMMGA